MSEYEPSAGSPEASQTGPAPPALPFDILTFLLGIWRRSIILLVFALLSVAGGYLAASRFGAREYEATAMLLYDPPALEDEADAAAQLSVNTLVDLFKTRHNLEAIREKLNISAKIKAIGYATTVELRRKTTLLEIRARWDDPKTAASIANSMYACFFEHLDLLQGEKRGQALEDLNKRLDEVNEELERRDQELKQFTLENRIVDLDKEAQWYLQQLVTLNTDHDRAVSRLQSARKQRTEIGVIIKKLKADAAQESDAMAAKMSSVTEANIRIQRLRELIQEEQESRARLADLAVEEENMKRATKLRELDAISQAEYDKVVAEHERAKAMTFDSEQITKWKQEIEKLDKAVVPSGGAASTLSGDVMRSVMLKAIDIQLEETATQEEVRSLDEARKRTEARLATIPQVKQAHAERERRVEALVVERKTLQNMIATTHRRLKSSQVPFRVVSKAEPSLYPRKSNRKVIFIGVVFAGLALGGLLVVLLELLDFTVKSAGSLKAAISAPVLAVLPRVKNEETLLPGPRQPRSHTEAYRRLALALRRGNPDEGKCILLAGASHGVGTSTVTLNLAALLQLSAEKVLVIDGHTEPEDSREDSVSVADYVDADPTTLIGLGDYLADGSMAAQSLTYPLDTIGCAGIVCSSHSTIPEMLHTARMRELIEALKAEFSVILIDAPGLLSGVNAEALAACVDAAVYVTRSGKNSIPSEKRCYKRLANTGTPVVGTVLTDVLKLYVREPGAV
jgi:uncharacterized protein involved in exopolysaccharide biosynthesis/Mrp family chromosome partitioning ATPase